MEPVPRSRAAVGSICSADSRLRHARKRCASALTSPSAAALVHSRRPLCLRTARRGARPATSADREGRPSMCARGSVTVVFHVERRQYACATRLTAEATRCTVRRAVDDVSTDCRRFHVKPLCTAPRHTHRRTRDLVPNGSPWVRTRTWQYVSTDRGRTSSDSAFAAPTRRRCPHCGWTEDGST